MESEEKRVDRAASSAPSRSVAIIGGGLAGLACGLAAAQAGAAVQLYAAGGHDAVPASYVDVVPNLLRGLVRLGVGDACVRAGFPYRRTSVIGRRGTPLFSLDAARLAGARYPGALGITWGKLKAVLTTAAIEAGVTLRQGERALDVGQEAQGALVFVARREPVRVDLAVMACGVRGGLRERVFLAQALPAGAEWSCFLAPRPLGLDDALQATTATGDRVHVVPVSGSVVGVRIASRHATRDMDARALRALLSRFPVPIAAIAAHVEDDTPVVRQKVTPGLLPQPWPRGSVIAVGGCAHALPPHFGQSAAQAVEDAVVLGELLAQPSDRRALAQAFAQRRTTRVQQVTSIAMQAARWQAEPDGDTDLLELARSLDQVVHQPA